MQLIYDHLTAVILASAIFFILVSIQVRGNQTTQDQTHYYASKAHLLDIREMVEHDFSNIGAGVAPSDSVFLAMDDSTFAFMAKVYPSDEDPSKITYRRVRTGTASTDTAEVPLYEVRRYVDDVLTGKSIDTLREFVVELRNGDREPVGGFAGAEMVHVRFTVMSPLGGMDPLHEARWNRTFRPPNLSNL